MYTFRPTRPADAELLPAIERSAAEAFLPMPDLASVAVGDVAGVEHPL